ncbi:MAG TPA: DNA-directed RNA polymerase subunit alpha [bacterium]|nr:DNA-directed RNA polymerase subunit alpha [bacterium]
MIPFPKKPKIKKIEKNRAQVEIEALYPGYGVTIGNSLRRVLLSSIEGAAVTQMKIKGVSHEFTTIPGVLEDVIQIMLNLKQLRFKMIGDKPQKATLKVKGEKKVLGKDFELPAQLELVNKDCHIATLTSKTAKLEMEILVEKGVGYSPREEREKAKMEIGTIPVDAIFSPVKNVAMKVENMRVGKRTDYDRLILDITTDGTINPEEAFKRACQILIDQFSFLIEEHEKEKKGKKTK